MAAQSHDAAARASDVAQQKLEDGCGADDLNAVGMLRPTDGIADCGGFLRTGCVREDLGHSEKLSFRNAAHILDQLRRVASEMPFQDIKDTVRVLEGGIGFVPAQVAGLAATVFAVTTARASMS